MHVLLHIKFTIIVFITDLLVTFCCLSVTVSFWLWRWMVICLWRFFSNLFVTFFSCLWRCVRERFYWRIYWWFVCDVYLCLLVLLTVIGDLFVWFVCVCFVWMFAEVICGWALGIYLFVSLIQLLAQTTSQLGCFFTRVVVRTKSSQWDPW